MMDFSDLPPVAVALALSRLAKQRILEHVRRSIYYFPKETVIGKSRPNPHKVAEVVFGLNNTRTVKSGVAQFNRLGLTTQVSAAMTFAADRRVNKKKIFGISVHSNHRRLDEQKTITSEERTILDVLRDIHHIPDATPAEVLGRIRTLIGERKFDQGRLVRFSLIEPPRVRALLGALIESLPRRSRKTDEHIRCLRDHLNELTTYRLPGVLDMFPSARRWGIK
jgi:hypothetical protein